MSDLIRSLGAKWRGGVDGPSLAHETACRIPVAATTTGSGDNALNLVLDWDKGPNFTTTEFDFRGRSRVNDYRAHPAATTLPGTNSGWVTIADLATIFSEIVQDKDAEIRIRVRNLEGFTFRTDRFVVNVHRRSGLLYLSDSEGENATGSTSATLTVTGKDDISAVAIDYRLVADTTSGILLQQEDHTSISRISRPRIGWEVEDGIGV